jgi:hypothetical protein
MGKSKQRALEEGPVVSVNDIMMPKAVRQETIKSLLVDCYLLNDGRELISGRAAVRAITVKADGKTVAAGHTQLSRFVGRLPKEYAHLGVAAGVRFLLPDGGIGEGISPEQFADIVGAYAALFIAGKLGRNACAIQAACFKIGISELVSEALGTTRPAHERHRQRFFDRIFLHEATKWQMTFKPTLARELAKFYGVKYDDGPYPVELRWIFGWIYDTILGEDVANEMRRRNVDVDRYKHHQIMKNDVHNGLKDELELTEVLARQSFTKDEFLGRMSAHYRGTGLQRHLF